MRHNYFEIEKASERDSWVIPLLTKEQLDSLERFFQENNIPKMAEMKSIVVHLNTTDYYVRTWFRYRLFGEIAAFYRRRYLPRAGA